MAISFQDYLKAIKSNVAQRVIKIEVLNNAEEAVATVEPNLLNGELQLNSGNGARRNSQFTLDNSTGEY